MKNLLHLCAAYALVLSTFAQIPPPSNDDVANATPVQSIFPHGNIYAEGTTAGATRESGEPVHPLGVASVWFKWTPSFSGILGTSFIELGYEFVRQGFFISNGPSAADLVPAPTWGGRLLFTAGQTYYLGFFSAPDKTGPFRYAFNGVGAHPPENDQFGAATEFQMIDNAVTLSGTTMLATSEPGEPPSAGSSVWFKWRPLLPGKVGYTTIWGPQVELFTGDTLASLTPVSDNQVIPGQTYYFRVSTSENGAAHFESKVYRVLSVPPNNSKENAIEFFGRDNLLSVTLPKAFALFWWKFTAPETGYILASAERHADYRFFRSDGSHIAGAYIPVQAGETLYFTISQIYPETTYAVLRVQFGTLPVPNDHFENAQLVDLSTPFVSHNAGATVQSGEPIVPQGDGRTVWFTWRAAADGKVRFASSHVIRAFRGTELASLTPAMNNGWIEVASGELLYLQVDSAGQDYAELSIRLADWVPAHPPNDSFAHALYRLEGAASMKFATLEPGEPSHAPFPHKSLWWQWHADQTGEITIAGFVNQNRPVVAIYEGDSIATLRLLAHSLDGDVTCKVHMGRRYHLAIAAPQDAEGDAYPYVRSFFPEWNNGIEQGNLIENGGFDNHTTTLPSNWLVDGYASRRFDLRQGAPNGSQALLMPGAPAAVSQNVIIQPGKVYRLRFACTSAEYSGPSRLRVFWNYQEIDDVETSWNTLSPSTRYWHWREFLVHSPTSTATLTFQAETATYLDAVLLVPDEAEPPTIDEHPVSQRVLAGRDAIFEVKPGGKGPFWFRWYRNGELLAGELQSSLRLQNVSPADAAVYHVVVFNASGAAASSGAVLDLASLDSATILVQPASTQVYADTYHALSVWAAGPGPLIYEWFKDGALLANQNGPNLVFNNVQESDSGRYQVRVSGSTFSSLSDPALLSVLPKRAGPEADRVITGIFLSSPIFDVDGQTRLTGSAFSWQVLFGSAQIPLAPAGLPRAFGEGVLGQQPGFPSNLYPPFSVPWIPSAQVHAQVRVWESAFGATYEAAKAAGGKFGETTVSEFSYSSSSPWRFAIHHPSFNLNPGSPAWAYPPNDRSAQTLTFHEIPDQEMGGQPTTLQAQASSGLPVIFSIDYGPARVEGKQLFLTGAGEVQVRALQPGNSSFHAATEVLRRFRSTPAHQTITFDPVVSSDLIARASSGLPVSFRVLSGPARVAGSVLQDVGEGPFVIEAFQTGNENYLPASPVQLRVILKRHAQTIAFDKISDLPVKRPNPTLGSPQPFASAINLAATASSGLPVTFALVSGPAVLNGRSLQPNDYGRIVVRASQSGDDYFAAAAVEQEFVVFEVFKSPQVISFPPIAPIRLGSGPLTLSATTGSGLPISFELIWGPAEIQGNSLMPLAAGTIGVRAFQAGNDEFEPASAEREIVVQKQLQSVEFSSVPALRLNSPPAELRASASSGLPVSFEILSGPANLNGALLAPIGTGSVLVRANQPGNDLFEAGFAEQQIIIGKALQEIDFSPTAPVRPGDAPVQLLASASSGLPVTFQVVSGPATLVGNLLQVTGIGSIVVRASQAGNDRFESASVERIIASSKSAQSIEFDLLPPLRFGDVPQLLHATTSSGLPVTFEIVFGPAKVAGNLLEITGAGTVLLRAVQAGDDRFESASAEQVIPVGRRKQTIDFSPVPALRFGDSVPLTASSSSDLPVRFEVLSGAARVADDLLIIEGVGAVTVRAFQPGDQNHEPATVEQEVLVGKAEQAIHFSIPATLRLDQSPFALAAAADSKLPVSFAIHSGAASLDAAILSFEQPGHIVLKLTQPGDDRFEPQTVEWQIEVKKRLQTLSFEALPPLRFGRAPLRLVASASSDLPVVFEVVSGKARFSGNVLELTGAGPLVVRVVQPGNQWFEEVTSEQQVIVEKKAQIIDFPPLPQLRYGMPPILLKASSSSGLPVRFLVSSGPAQILESSLILTGLGELRLTITQPGDDDFMPAPNLIDTYTIGRGLQSIEFNPPAEIELSTEPIVLSASADSALPVALSLLSGQARLIDSFTLLPLEPGAIVVEATQPGNNLYEPALPVRRTISIVQTVRLSAQIERQEIVLQWPAANAGQQLEAANSIEGPWVTVPNPDAKSAIRLPVIMEPGRFFRLSPVAR
jgi:hypothetical protein